MTWRTPFAAATIATAALVLPGSLSAHHSTAMFDWGKSKPIATATVERWDWTNPHTFLYVQVPDGKGGSERWAFEGMSPSHLARNGWSRSTLAAGQRIALTYYPLKDGRKGGFVVTVTPSDGKTLFQLPQAMP